MKKVLIGILLAIVVLIGVVVVFSVVGLGELQTKYKEYTLTEITPDMVKDGEYVGKFDSMLNTVELRVKVENKRMTSIEILALKSGPGYGASNMVERFLEKQAVVNVDSVSGATGTSKAYKIALHKALSQGLTK